MRNWSRPPNGWDHRHWTSAERSDYERDLLRSLRENMDFTPTAHGAYVLSVDLHGTYPETVGTVRYRDVEKKQVRCWNFDVWPWREDPNEIGAHAMNDPDGDASMLNTNWIEDCEFFGGRNSRHCE